jgi:hypothetical protein
VEVVHPSDAVGGVKLGADGQLIVALAPAGPIVGVCAPALSNEKTNKKTMHERKQSTARRGSFLFPWVEKNLNGL